MTAPRRGRRRSSRAKGGGPGRHHATSHHTSVPTSRTAYVETRRWLLQQHGPVCAYCARRVDPDDITLDHVTPRRGQSAYDRRDNLVLCCPTCNAKKADKAFLAFLLGDRRRAEHLLRYGDHLSPMLVHHIQDIAGPEAVARAKRLADPDYPYRD
jgi:hypothetical protein